MVILCIYIHSVMYFSFLYCTWCAMGYTGKCWLWTWGSFVHYKLSRLWCLLLLLLLVKLSVGSTTELMDTAFFNKAWLGTARDLTLARGSGRRSTTRCSRHGGRSTTWCSRHGGRSHISLCNRRARAEHCIKIENNNTYTYIVVCYISQRLDDAVLDIHNSHSLNTIRVLLFRIYRILYTSDMRPTLSFSRVSLAHDRNTHTARYWSPAVSYTRCIRIRELYISHG